jgi:hypothetical protein
MTTNTEIFADRLFGAIKSKDIESTRLALAELRELMRNDVQYILWLTEPANLTTIHRLLVENFAIPPKAMMVKMRNMTRLQKGFYFLQGIENGVKRVV